MLSRFCTRSDAKWFRYVDDVKIFTKSERDAREAVFVINDALRSLHLNLQGSKTAILSNGRMKQELDPSEMDVVEAAHQAVKSLDPRKPADQKKITKALIPTRPTAPIHPHT